MLYLLSSNERKCMRQIQGIDKEGNSIGIFSTAVEAEKATGVASTNISAVCRGDRKSAGGYKWKYLISEEHRSTVTDAIDRHNLTGTDWQRAWIKEKGISLLVENPDKRPDGSVDLEQVREDFVENLKKYAPKYPKLDRKNTTDPHLLILDPADLHIGKLGYTYEEYNTEKALERADEGIKGICSKAKAWNIDKIVFVIGNDVLHIDNTKRTTTSGTPQDTDRSWYDNYLAARKLYVRVIENLLTIADVHVVHCPSNHDYMSGTLLADSVKCWFSNNKNVTFDVSPYHRKYFRYGKSLLSFSHGDGAKMAEMPLLMAEEAKEEWALTDYRYIYLHHLHHKRSYKFQAAQDFIGVSVEYLRSPSGTDRWHSDNGYQGAIKAIEGFIHGKDTGQVARLTHCF